MSSHEAVNLDEVGRLSRSGQTYHQNAEDNLGTARSHVGRMEQAQHGFKGAAGSTFQAAARVVGGNHGLLARQIAQQARRAVAAERAALAGDAQAEGSQRAVHTAAETLTSAFTRPVNV